MKQDKFKENYLGHSLHASKPTFNDPNPNPMWYLKGKDEKQEVSELQRLKQLEQDMMMEAL